MYVHSAFGLSSLFFFLPLSSSFFVFSTFPFRPWSPPETFHFVVRVRVSVSANQPSPLRQSRIAFTQRASALQLARPLVVFPGNRKPVGQLSNKYCPCKVSVWPPLSRRQPATSPPPPPPPPVLVLSLASYLTLGLRSTISAFSLVLPHNLQPAFHPTRPSYALLPNPLVHFTTLI